MVLSEYFLFFLIFYSSAAKVSRMITFDRQAGPLQNFNRSHVMAIGGSVSFSDPRDLQVGVWGAPNSPPPKFFFFLHAFQNPRNIFEKKKFSREKKLRNFSPPPPKKFLFFAF